MTGPFSRGADWLPSLRTPPWLLLMAGVCLGLGGTAGLMWSDASGWTRSALCGPRCYDEPVQEALMAQGQDVLAGYRAARQASMRQLEISPYDSAAWLRLVLLETRIADGELTPSATDALARSYERAPVDASIARWRIPIAFSYWPQLSSDLRRRAVEEVNVLYNAPENRTALRNLAREIRSQEGVFAFVVLLQSADADEALFAGRETPAPTPSARAQKPAIAGD